MSRLIKPTRLGTALTAALGVTVLLLLPSAAEASRLPADPLTTVAAPVAVTQLVTDAHASSVRAAVADLHGFTTTLRTP